VTGPDEPNRDDLTVVGHRPIGPTRGGRRPGGPGGPTPPPLPPFNPVGAEPSRVEPRPSASPIPPQQARPSTPPRAEPMPTAMQPVEEPNSPEDTLVAAASPLLLMIAQLRDAVDSADVTALRREVVDQLKRFEDRAVKFGAKGGDVGAARYVLCAMIDETVMTTPWGSASNWSANSVLNQFHGETWGGEKAFEILDRVRAEPTKYLSLLKLIDLCLLLGFEGKYRVIEGGRERLEDLRNELGRILRQYGTPAPKELSAEWRGISERRTLRTFLPLWVVFSIAGILTLALYGTLQWQLSNAIAPVETRLDALARSPADAGARR
jgi:type VI secretion system protein ImpK